MLPIGASTADRTIHVGAPPGGDGRGRRGARCRHVLVVAVPLLIVRARRIALPECQGGTPPRVSQAAPWSQVRGAVRSEQ